MDCGGIDGHLWFRLVAWLMHVVFSELFVVVKYNSTASEVSITLYTSVVTTI